MVEGDRLAGELPRSPPGRRRQHGPDPHPLRAHGHRSHHHPRVVRFHVPDTDAVPVKSAVPTRLFHLAGELRDGARIPRWDHEPVTQAYLLSPMPRSHTTNEYTDPQARANHRTQRTAEIRYNLRLCIGWGGMIDCSLQAPKEGSTQDQLRRDKNIVCELRRARL